MCNRFNQQVMHPVVNIWDDGLDERGIPSPFDFEGMPRQRVNIIKDGVAVSPVYDRYTARKVGKTSTGDAMPPEFSGMGPMPGNLFMASGTTSTADLIRSTERGLYITRFWYTRPVHPRDCVVTGMTRDRVFMIEQGEVTYPVKNLPFTQSYVQALAEVEVTGSETRLLSAWNGLVMRVPALKMKRFNFTGSTV